MSDFKQTQNLSIPEQQLLIATPVLISILIAGADEEIDQKEQQWSSKLVQFRTSAGDPLLMEYYQEVDQVFETLLSNYLKVSGATATERTNNLSAELKRLNDVLPKLEREYAEALLRSWKDFAKKVAEASGGFLGFAKISPEEEALIGLPMLDF